MATTHKKYFDQLIKDVESVIANAAALIISKDGLAVASNCKDESLEAQLAALASMNWDQGNKLFSAPNGHAESAHTFIMVGEKRFILMMHLAGDAMLVVSGEDKNQLAVVSKKAFEHMEQLRTMAQNKELIF